MVRRLLFFLFLLLAFSACSSWNLKEKCDQTNWFEYSRDVAMSGRYLEEDRLIKDCKGVDHISSQQMDIGFKSGRERYCTFESFLRNGESGEPVNFKMCDGLTLYQMQERYAQGLKSFCTAETGYVYGASGKFYKNVCLKKDEEKFLPKYFSGRSEFLKKALLQMQVELQSLTSMQSTLQSQISQISHEVTSLPAAQDCQTINVYNEATKSNVPQVVCKEAYYIQNRRNNLYSQLDPLRNQSSEAGARILRLEGQIEEARREQTKIPVVYQAEVIPPKT